MVIMIDHELVSLLDLLCILIQYLGKGWYMFIETSYPRKPNDTAALVSPAIQKTGSYACVIFWYHMFGPHIASLNVYMKVCHDCTILYLHTLILAKAVRDVAIKKKKNQAANN